MGFKEAVREVFPHAQFTDEIEANRTLSQKARRIEGLFTFLVDCLRHYPNPKLAAMGRDLWDVIHHRHVYTLMNPVRTPHFAVLQKKGASTLAGFIYIPIEWPRMFEMDPIMGTGAVIFTGSQAVDYYNDRLVLDGTPLMGQRAQSYEAEFLRTCDSSKLNDYQRHVLKTYPNGLEARFEYEHRPVGPLV